VLLREALEHLDCFASLAMTVEIAMRL